MLTKYDWLDFEAQIITLNHTSIFKIHIPEVIAEVNRINVELLSDKEKAKANRFKFLADKERFLTARVVLKLLLKHISGVSLNPIDLETSKTGKPFFKNIEFNLAHSGNYVLIAIANNPVGIDVEIPNDDFDFDLILDNTFSSEEISYINQNHNRKERFLTLWTRKEALLKATGEGLTDDLAYISVLDERITRMESNFILNSFKINDIDIASVAQLNTSGKMSMYDIRSNFFNPYN
ncbi:4'-phosphopantetheinyl transferase [Pedobacter sp. UYP30]|uniref:4'-phosphopantetheinyl transferase family protein n=1 Tax=Pedobacter sp. UYP30 TaxID=1756400 RepID=UPI00339A995B